MTKEALKRFTVYLEEEQVEALQEVARELRQAYGGRWSRGAVLRLALSQFLTQRGRLT